MATDVETRLDALEFLLQGLFRGATTPAGMRAMADAIMSGHFDSTNLTFFPGTAPKISADSRILAASLLRYWADVADTPKS